MDAVIICDNFSVGQCRDGLELDLSGIDLDESEDLVSEVLSEVSTSTIVDNVDQEDLAEDLSRAMDLAVYATDDECMDRIANQCMSDFTHRYKDEFFDEMSPSDCVAYFGEEAFREELGIEDDDDVTPELPKRSGLSLGSFLR